MSTKKPTTTYAKMISTAISSLKDRTGSSPQAIAKFVYENYEVDADKAAPHLRRALKKGVEDGVFQTARKSGKGARSYKMVMKKSAAAKKPKASTSTKKSGAGSMLKQENIKLKQENIKLKQEIAQLTLRLQALSVTLWENSTRREEVESQRETVEIMRTKALKIVESARNFRLGLN